VSKEIQAIRGMNDCLPQETPVWQYLEQQLRSIVAS
jgi:histidyl-tRNA synthetase